MAIAQPTRTCLGCGRKRPKAELRRLVLDARGWVRFDARQVLPGRGGYLCGRACLPAAAKRRAFGRVFRRPEVSMDLSGLEQDLLSVERN